MSATPGTLHARFGRVLKRRRLLVAALALGVVASLLLDLQAGPSDLDLWQVIVGLVDPDSLDPRQRIILWQVRLPDALIAIVVGGALGLAGIEAQTALDNPLASPFTLGVSSAAVLGASIAIVLGPAVPLLPGALVLPGMALIFSLGSGLLVLAVAQLATGARQVVVLFGIALVFLCNALTAGLQYLADADAVQEIVFWSIGNLTRAGWFEVGVVAAAFVAVLPFSLRHVWLLTLLRGGEAHARSVGIDVRRLRALVILRVSVLAAFAVCFVGTIGFVGLVGPHIARLLLGEDHRLLMPGSVLCGALILSLASFLSKTLVPGAIVPVGILTAIVGVPAFLVLLAAQRRRP